MSIYPSAAAIAEIPNLPTDGEPVLIARTEQKERADGSGSWWKEFRCRHLRAAYPYAVVLEVRYYGPGSAKIENGHDWTFWWGDATIEACIWEMLGDTAFERAESIDPRHREGVELLRERRAFDQARHDLEGVIRNAEARAAELQDAANEDYRARLARQPDESKHAAIQARCLKKWGGIVQDAKVERDAKRSLRPAAEAAVKACEEKINRWLGIPEPVEA